MDDFAAILVLLALAVLTVPVLLVVALVKIGNAKARIDALERDVEQLHGRLHEVESTRGATAAATQQTGPRAQPSAAPAPPARTTESWRDGVAPGDSALDAIERDPNLRDGSQTGRTDDGRVSGVASGSDPIHAGASASASASRRARFDLPDDPAPPAEATAAVPPPLPPLRKTLTDPVAGPRQEGAAVVQPPPRPPRPQRTPPPDFFDKAIGWVRGWFTEGNVPVKIGMLVLFFGVASLLKYASDQGWVRVPIELRLAGVAAAAIAGLVFAWRQRETRRSFSLSLQGGAIGVLMLVTFAAYKLYEVIPAGAAFAITIALVAGIGVLAVLQNALALAVFGILAGFLAPIWLSTGSGNHVALFGYYAVLNLGIFGIAWNRPWRLLNLLGFVFTFGIGTVWGVLDYRPEKFATTEPFLLLFFALYLLIPIFYAHRRSESGRSEQGHDGNAHALVDGTLVFGTPLVAFALQAGLLQGERMPLALSALGAAAVYVLLAAALRRRERFASLVDTYAVLAVGFSTLSVPLALSARATASVFALEGAALVWLGVRQGRRLPQISGLLLQLAAAVAYMAGIGGIGSGFSQSGVLDVVADTPIANPAFMGALLIALAGFATAWTYRREHDGDMVGLIALWAVGWWSFAGGQEIVDHIAYPDRVDALFAFVALTGWMAAEVRRREGEMTVLGGVAAVALALGIPAALLLPFAHDHPFGGFGAAAWLVYAALGWRSLICLRDTGAAVRFVAHGGWLWSWVVAIAATAVHFAGEADMGDGWVWIGIGMPVLVFAALLQLRPVLLAPPLTQAGDRDGFDDYRRALLASAWVVLGMSWGVSLFFPGQSAPLPWVSLLNPLELLQIAVLALLAQRVWSGRGTTGSQAGVAVFALAAFAWITFATLRATHHWGGTDWSPSMLDDYVVQTALTVVWSVLGVLGWIFGSRRGDRLLWGAGAVLMGVVLLKLLLIDRGHLGNLFGIVSFIAYGLLCTAVGYFAPAPPRRAASTEEVSA